MIVRGPRLERDFTVLTNAVLRDERLSYKARGLLACLLSQPPGYSVNALRLAEASPDGRVAVQSGLRELEACGYLRRDRQRRPDGTFQAISVVYEAPQDVDQPAAGNLRAVPPGDTRESPGGTGRTEPARGSPADKEVLDEELPPEELTPPSGLQPDVPRLCDLLADLIEANGSKRPPVGKTWHTEMDRLLRIDGRTPEQVERAIRWCQADAFWRANILSVPTLRKQYDRLRLAAKRDGGGRPPAFDNTDARRAEPGGRIRL